VELNQGVANVGTQLSLATRSAHLWAAQVPLDLFLDSVLPFSNVNEAVTNWRPLFHDATLPLLLAAAAEDNKDLDDYSITELVYIVKEGLWSTAFDKQIRRSCSRPARHP
jgi:hypothetical protein